MLERLKGETDVFGKNRDDFCSECALYGFDGERYLKSLSTIYRGLHSPTLTEARAGGRGKLKTAKIRSALSAALAQICKRKS